MKQSISSWALVLISSLLVGDTSVLSATNETTSVRKPESSVNYTNMLIKTGGLLQTPAEGSSILFLNAQKRINAAVLSGILDEMRRVIRLPMMISESKLIGEPSIVAAEALKDKSIAAVIVICDIPGQPQMLIAPEARWATVNVSPLATAGIEDEKLSLRTQKQCWRAFGYLLGAANSNFEVCVLKPVFSVEDLDALKGKALSPEAIMKIGNQAKKLGIKASRTTTYRKACEEGWAQMPTNSFQKAIWEEVKAKKAVTPTPPATK